MNNQEADLQILLKKALNMEIEAGQLFFVATGKTHKKEVKKLLNHLAKEEEQHFFTVLKVFNRLTENTKSLIYSNKDRQNAVAQITQKIKQAGINNDSSLKDIIMFALKEEGGAQNYYNKCMKNCSDNSIKRILEKLIVEEKEHEKSLRTILKNLESKE